MIKFRTLLSFFCFYYLINKAFVISVILLEKFKSFFNLSKHQGVCVA